VKGAKGKSRGESVPMLVVIDEKGIIKAINPE